MSADGLQLASTDARREDTSFRSGAERCAAWIYTPEGAGLTPAIVMAHGFGAVRAARLDAYARRFRAAGYSVLVFDYRHFGDSGGQPRQLLDLSRILEDWRNAVAFARSESRIDPQRVALWGSSFSGGHVLAIAAGDPRVAAVISQVPFADGLRNPPTGGPRQAAGLMVAAARDLWRARRSRTPYYVPIAAPPGCLAIMNSPDSLPGYLSLFDAPDEFDNRVAARVVPQMLRYRPAADSASIRCPLLVQVAERDRETPARLAARAAGRAPRGELRRHVLTHFEAYRGEPFERFVAEQLDFLSRHLPTAS